MLCTLQLQNKDKVENVVCLMGNLLECIKKNYKKKKDYR